MKNITLTKQNIAVLEHIQKHGYITTAAAFSELGISRLSARIYDLKHLAMSLCVRTNPAGRKTDLSSDGKNTGLQHE